MKILLGFVTMIASGISFWFLISGLLMASTHRPYMESILSAADVAPENGTIPPILFTKTATTATGANVYSQASVTYTIGIRVIPTDTYSATLKIVDTLTATAGELSPRDVTVTAGITEIIGTTITWTVPVSTTGAYSLTYRVQAPSVQTQTVDVVNTAILYEIDNSNGLTTTKTLSKTVNLKVIPWNLYLSNVLLYHTPTPTPTPTLPPFQSYNFEDENRFLNWGDADKNIIYSTDQNFLAGTDGKYYAWLGGVPNKINQITSQKVTLPTGYTDIRIRYRYWIFSEEDECGEDTLVVKVNGTSRTIETQDGNRHELCKAGITSGWKNARTKNLAGNWSGKEVEVSFETDLNESRNSNFFVDVVELCSASGCQLTEQFVNPGESNDTNSKLDIPSR